MNRKSPDTVSITGIAGGVGKSSLAAALGLHFASTGKKALLVDLGDSANAALGDYTEKEPEYLLDHYFRKEKSLEDVIVPSRTPNLSIARAGRRFQGGFNSPFYGTQLVRDLQSIPYDIVVLDIGMLSDGRKLAIFSGTGKRYIVVPTNEKTFSGIGEVVFSSLFSSFKNFRIHGRDKLESLQRLEDEYAAVEDLDFETFAMRMGEIVPGLEEKWTEYLRSCDFSIVVNSVPSAIRLELVESLLEAYLDRVQLEPSSVHFIPYCAAGGLGAAGVAPHPVFENRNFKYATSLLLADFEEKKGDETLFSKHDYGNLFFNISPTGKGEAQTPDGKDASAAENGNAVYETQPDETEQLQKIRNEMDLIRAEKFYQVSRKVEGSIAEKREAGLKQLEQDNEEGQRKIAEDLMVEWDKKLIQLEAEAVEERVKIEADQAKLYGQRLSKLEAEMEAVRDARLAEVEMELEEYYKNAKIGFDHELRLKKTRMEAGYAEEIGISRRQKQVELEKSVLEEMEKVKKAYTEEVEATRQKLIGQVDELVERHREARMGEVEIEREKRLSGLETDVRDEASAIRRKLLEGVFEDVMETTVKFDLEDETRRKKIALNAEKFYEKEKESAKSRIRAEIEVFEKRVKEEAVSRHDSFKKGKTEELIAEAASLKEKILKEAKVFETAEREKLLKKTSLEASSYLESEKTRIREEFSAQRDKKETELESKLNLHEEKQVEEIRKRIKEEEEKLIIAMDKKLAALKVEKSEAVETEIMAKRELMMDSLGVEIDLLKKDLTEAAEQKIREAKKDAMLTLQRDIAELREKRIAESEKSIRGEIRARAESFAAQLSEQEERYRAESSARLAAEEKALWNRIDAELNKESLERKNESALSLKSYVEKEEKRITAEAEAEKQRRVKDFEELLEMRRVREETSIKEFFRKEQERRVRELDLRIDAEEKTRREIMFEKNELEREKLENAIRQQIAILKVEENEKLANWAETQKTGTEKLAQEFMDRECERLTAEFEKEFAVIRKKRIGEMERGIDKERNARLRKLGEEAEKTRVDLLAALDEEIKATRLAKEGEIEFDGKERAEKLATLINSRHMEIIRKKEEWIEFEANRRLKEQRELMYKEVSAEREVLQQQNRAELERSKSLTKNRIAAELQAEKAKKLRDLSYQIEEEKEKKNSEMIFNLEKDMESKRKAAEEELAEWELERKAKLEKDFEEQKKRRLASFEKELEQERIKKLEHIERKLKVEEYEMREEILTEIMKKKSELDNFYEKEKKKYLERLQNEILERASDGKAGELLREELEKLHKTWRFN